MDEIIRQQLNRGQTIDITTIGRRSGRPHRIEIWFHYLDGQVYITGRPGQRDWYANLVANAALTFHLKQDLVADLAARAVPVTDPAERRAILGHILQQPGWSGDLEVWVARSPLVRVDVDER